jgi:nitrogen fixation protein NifU and related proteins
VSDLSETPAAIEALYREVVLEHYRNPRNRAPLAHATAEALVVNPVCGDQVRVEVELAGGRIANVSARARGCSIAVAAGSVMTELVHGMTPEQARALGDVAARISRGEATDPAIDSRLRAFARVSALPSRQRCATLAWEALTEALAQA